MIDREGGAATSFNPRRLLSIGLITGVLSIVLYFSGIQLPELIVQPCSFIGSLTTPLSMLIIGANMNGFAFKDIFAEKRIFIMSLLRLLAMPLITAFYLSMLTTNKPLICMAAMTIGMPVGSMVAMAGSKYEATARVSNLCVVISTILSMVTIPILAVIFKLWFGV
jgi:hypothetical protein